MPTATDLVTDLPADFEVFGQAVATSMADLLGGTTGQVLSKTTNADMDFTWVTTDDANAIQNTIVDAKGDLIGATAADTPARLAVGTNGQVLTADSTAATGLKWSTASLGMTLISTTSFSAVASQAIPTVFSSTYTNYKILINISACTGTSTLNLRLRSGATDNSTAGNYLYQNFQFGGITVGDALAQGWSGSSATSFVIGSVVSNSGYQNRWVVADVLSPFETFKTGFTADVMSGNAGPYDYANKVTGRMDVTTAYDGFTIISGSGNITGKVSVYGYNI